MDEDPINKLLSLESKKPSRPSAPGERVQVKATPINNRFRDIFAAATTESQSGGRGDCDGHENYSQQYEDHYPMPVNRELLFPTRSQQDFLPASPRFTTTPVTGRIQATPVRMSTSVPDSAARVATTATTAHLKTSITATTSKFSVSRLSRLEPFPEEEDSVPMSSPVAARRVAPISTQVGLRSGDMSGSGAGLHAFRRLHESMAFLDGDLVPASSPLQARSQPSIAVAAEGRDQLSTLLPAQQQNVVGDTPPSPSFVTRANRITDFFETPTKARPAPKEDVAAMQSIMGTPLLARPTAAVGGANGIQSLYQQMGWDDELDDLA